MKSNCFAQTASLIIVSFVTRLDLATSDEYDDRVEFCKRHLSPTVAEDARYRQLQREHGVKRDVDEEERYSTLDDCFRAKFFNPDRQDEAVVMQTVRTNGHNFEEKLLNIDKNVTKLIVETTFEPGLMPGNYHVDFLPLNLSGLVQFVSLEELWLRNIPYYPDMSNVVEMVCDAEYVANHIQLKRLHVNLPLRSIHFDLSYFENLTLLNVVSDSGRQMPLIMEGSLKNLTNLRVLSVLQLWQTVYTRKLLKTSFEKDFTSSLLYLEMMLWAVQAGMQCGCVSVLR